MGEITKYLGGLAFDDIVARFVVAAIFQLVLFFFLFLFGKHAMIEKPKKWMFWVGGFLCFLLLSHVVLLATAYVTTQLNEIRKGVQSPKGSLRMGVQNVFAGPTPSRSEVGVFFWVRVANSGPRTTAWAWKLTTELPNGQKIESLQPFDEGEATISGTESNSFTLRKQDYLPAVLNKPLESGSSVVGWVWFTLKGVPPEFLPLGTKFTLEFEDIEGRKVTAEKLWTNPITTRIPKAETP